MRLLRIEADGEFSLVEYDRKDVPLYAILSHTWGADHDEVTFRDLIKSRGKSKLGYRKLEFCSKQATRNGLKYFWVDTCCIDKTNSSELQEAINSMFDWYHKASRCYAYLSDVSVSTYEGNRELPRNWKAAFMGSRWFTRGWTLQELIAPLSVEFFSEEGQWLGSKKTLEGIICEVTGIDAKALQGCPLSDFSSNERLSWAEKRTTRREEDAAYCLLGIFDVHMPLIYGEGRKHALARLEEQYMKSPLNLDQEKVRMLMTSLQFDQIDVRQNNVKDAHAKTCAWLLNKSEYLDWLNDTKLGNHHGFLWIKGKPGTGKSTIMKYALANAHERMTDKTILSFFFNARGNNLEKSTIGTYRSLLLQLLEQIPSLQTVFNQIIRPSSVVSTTRQWSIELLKTLLDRAIQRLGGNSLVCFIDALDECEESQIREMISFFEHVGDRAVSSKVMFRVCLSSRHYPHVTIRNGISLVLEGQDGHYQDIRKYLDSELKIGHSDSAKAIRRTLQEKASGTFMWVVLVTGILNREYDSGHMHALRRRLQEIPSDLHQLFGDMLTRDSYNRNTQILCLQWVLYSRQPLSPIELYFAILSGVDPEAILDWDPREVTTDVIRRFILDSSKGLVEVTVSSTPRAQFIHESVKDFLTEKDSLANVWPELGSNLQGQSHEWLKQCCLNCINIDIHSKLRVPEILPDASSQEAIYLRNQTTHAFPFLKYAVRNALYHANMAEGNKVAQHNLIHDFPLGRWITLHNLFQNQDALRYTDDVSLLYILAEDNLSNIIKIHPSKLLCLTVEQEQYGPPLFAAIVARNKEAVRAFLEAYLETQHAESWFRSVYAKYSEGEGRLSNFGVHFRFSKYKTLLSYLGEISIEAVFALGLVTENIIPGSKDQDGRTPLWWTAKNGHEAVFKRLLDQDNVNVDIKDRHGQTPLWWAARNGHLAILKLLLGTNKVDVDTKDRYGETPLSWAARNGHEVIFRMLLNTGKVNINIKNIEGRSLLMQAIDNGHKTVVKLLLDTGKVNVDVQDCLGRNLLLQAIDTGDETMIKLLLGANKMDIDGKGRHGQTPLLLAAKNGHKEVVKLLLSTGKVDTNAKDSYERTPLCWAAKNGYKSVVELLLVNGKIDIDAKDRDKRTPLWWAAKNCHKTVYNVLLNTGKADRDAQDRFGQTPLSLAAWNGCDSSHAIARRLHE